MFRVLLITKNRSLAEFCRKNLPPGFQIKSVSRFHPGSADQHRIIIFDSGFLVEEGDSAVVRATEKYGLSDGAVSICLFMNEDHRSQTFSLFPDNLKQVKSILPYRLNAGKVHSVTTAEWHWFLENQRRQLGELSDRALVLGENRILSERIAQIKSELPEGARFPAFMHGRSGEILRFREQFISAASSQPYLLISGKDEIPLDGLPEFYCSLVRPGAVPGFHIVDLASIPAHLHLQAIWPAEKQSRQQAGIALTCVKNIQLLGWQNQATMVGKLKATAEAHAAGKTQQRFILTATDELTAMMRKGTFRQELYSLLKKASAELPALHERPGDITKIAAEYITQHGFSRLQEHNAEIAAKIMSSFDLSGGYRGLFLTLELMNDLEKSKGLPVFELPGAAEQSDAFLAARSFLREQVEPNPATLFEGLAGSEKEALSLEYVERHYIAAVCARYAWQVTDAARHLGISRKTLYDKMKRYKLNRPDSLRRATGKAS